MTTCSNQSSVSVINLASSGSGFCCKRYVRATDIAEVAEVNDDDHDKSSSSSSSSSSSRPDDDFVGWCVVGSGDWADDVSSSSLGDIDAKKRINGA